MNAVAHLCLGTASWGTVPYRDTTPPDDAELARILDVAAARGVRWLDTAEAYPGVEARLAKHRASDRFRIVSKAQPAAAPYGYALAADVVLLHLGPDDDAAWASWPDGWVDGLTEGEPVIAGMSVYTVAIAQAALALLDCRALQAPWSVDTHAAWAPVRDRAYREGALFFGRQPFGRIELNSQDERRKMFQFALESNPRGWCVVGAETAAQVAQLCDWRDALL